MKYVLFVWSLNLLRHLAHVVMIVAGCVFLTAWYRGNLDASWAFLRPSAANVASETARPQIVRLEITVPPDCEFQGYSGADHFVVTSKTPTHVSISVRREQPPRSLAGPARLSALPKQ